MDYNKIREETDYIIDPLDGAGIFLCDDTDTLYVELDVEVLRALLFDFGCYILEKYGPRG